MTNAVTFAAASGINLAIALWPAKHPTPRADAVCIGMALFLALLSIAMRNVA